MKGKEEESRGKIEAHVNLQLKRDVKDREFEKKREKDQIKLMNPQNGQFLLDIWFEAKEEKI